MNAVQIGPAPRPEKGFPLIKPHPWLVALLARSGAVVLRSWMRTLRYEYRPQGPWLEPRATGSERYIYAMWHEYLLLPILRYACPDVHVLISRSADGHLLSELCRRLSIPVIRGSSSRGGTEAVRQLLRAGLNTHLALTPDGPRGPRRRVQSGLVYLASRSGLPVVPVGFGLDRPRRLGSWDRFAIPRFASRAVCVTAEPVHVPADAGPDELEGYRRTVEDAMHAMTVAAESWAERERAAA
jgi:lysophospholipid acyltransferase (LPLAT)-like uncharacterized protein